MESKKAGAICHEVCMLMIVTALMVGCSTSPIDEDPSTTKDVWGVHEPFNPSAAGGRSLTTEHYLSGTFRTNYDSMVATNGLESAKTERNRILNDLLRRIDVDHGRYELAL